MSTVLHKMRSEIRGGGCGRRAWVAKILGPDDTYGLERVFIEREANVSRSGKSGSLHWELTEPGLYEYRDHQLGKGEAPIGELRSGFLLVTADGVEDLSEERAKELARRLK